jgi:hypothetical protein
MHDPAAHAALLDEFRRRVRAPVELHDLDLHINDDAFVDHALQVFDAWVAAGRVPGAAPIVRKVKVPVDPRATLVDNETTRVESRPAPTLAHGRSLRKESR